MAEQRLSKLQKWILENCYRVTVLKQRDDKTLARCKKFDETLCPDNVYLEVEGKELYKCKIRKYEDEHFNCSAYEFTQNDIYKNYFDMKLSRRMAVFSNKTFFVHTPDSDKIYNSTMRTLKGLLSKGLIIYIKFSDNYIIILTAKGKEIAEKLLM